MYSRHNWREDPGVQVGGFSWIVLGMEQEEWLGIYKIFPGHWGKKPPISTTPRKQHSPVTKSCARPQGPSRSATLLGPYWDSTWVLHYEVAMQTLITKDS